MKQADRKLSTARTTILQEHEAIKESPGEYDPGTDLETEAERIESARKDVVAALKLINPDNR